MGAREFLIAYNVNVNTRDQKLANEVALNIREAGRLKRDSQNRIVTDDQGQQVRVPGRLTAVRAIGWYIEQYRQAQVSVNLLSYRTTPLHEVFETTRDEASKLGLVVTGSELVGMTPLEPLVAAGRFYLRSKAGQPACRSASWSSLPSVRWASPSFRRSTRTSGSSSTLSACRHHSFQ